MTDQNVPATPENYQVWFTYVAQSSLDLTVELNSILRDDAAHNVLVQVRGMLGSILKLRPDTGEYYH